MAPWDYKNNHNLPYVVAEIGNNHEGSVENALLLIKKAYEAGADAVKFQTFKTDSFISPEDTKRKETLKKFELTYEDFDFLFDYANEIGIDCFATPLDLESLDFLIKKKCTIKVASSDNDFHILIKKALNSGLPVIISTGLLDLNQVRVLVRTISEYRNNFSSVALLHCVTSYPVPNEHAQLSSISMLQKSFPEITIGYSDHTIGNEACYIAHLMGAKIIEKHFTLDNNFSSFRDHSLSSDPQQLEQLIRRIEESNVLIGHDGKIVQACEDFFLGEVRRRAFFSQEKLEGERLAEHDLNWLRSNKGLLYFDTQKLIGKKLTRNIRAGEILLHDMLEKG